ncbi:MAG: hypothetical protein WAU31_00970, partial [Candidatus Moraniibacteriota bacterium]
MALLSSVALPYMAIAQDDAGNIQDDIQKYEKRLEATTKKKKTLEQTLNQVNVSLSVAIAAVQKT